MTPITDKLESLISGYGINQDDADWLRGVYTSQQAEPSDAMVEAAAMALARMSYGPQALDSDAAEWREHARAVLQAADAVSAVPDGFVLVPEKATPLIREALRIGMRREVPSDELCDIRWRAAIAAAAPGEQKGGV